MGKQVNPTASERAREVMEECRAKLDIERCRRTVANLIAKKLGTMSTRSDEYVGLVASFDIQRKCEARLTALVFDCDERIVALEAETALLREALRAARDHLEYTGYGDSWERECAQAIKLEEKIAAALKDRTR